MAKNDFDRDVEIHWCRGCGNFGLMRIIKKVLIDLGLQPQDVVIATGIGQAAKLPHFMKCHMINGLHGRYLSNAIAVKAVNPKLTVLAVSGDGCTYSEGGNHFLHTIRYNPNITNIVSNNQVYGLTKGQASPTTQLGFKDTGLYKITGVYNEPFNPLTIAIALGASFVARAYAGDATGTKEILKKAIQHEGYALMDLLSPCVSFNKVNTYRWYKENTYYLDESHDPFSREQAMEKALEKKKLPLGIYYLNPNKPTYGDNTGVYQIDKTPLFEREVDTVKLTKLIESYK
ncbi:MAG: thiamine pyrophosphate-dependent enzyme [Candidatus Hodarchaeales archaeon]|jgi:2-oxoglutarate ferredoxin oxidoreductase subunit beta